MDCILYGSMAFRVYDSFSVDLGVSVKSRHVVVPFLSAGLKAVPECAFVSLTVTVTFDVMLCDVMCRQNLLLSVSCLVPCAVSRWNCQPPITLLSPTRPFDRDPLSLLASDFPAITHSAIAASGQIQSRVPPRCQYLYYY